MARIGNQIGVADAGSSVNYRALCFVDMPFGQKLDLKSGAVVDFDQIYGDAINRRLRSAGWRRCVGTKSIQGDYPQRDVCAIAAG